MNYKVSFTCAVVFFLAIAGGSASAQTTQIENCELRVFFPNDVSLLNVTQISEIREFIRGATSDVYAIRGYASDVGETEYNLQLANERATNVGIVISQEGFGFQAVPIGEAGLTSSSRRAEIYRDSCATELVLVGQSETLLSPPAFVYGLGAVILGALATGGSSSTTSTD